MRQKQAAAWCRFMVRVVQYEPKSVPSKRSSLKCGQPTQTSPTIPCKAPFCSRFVLSAAFVEWNFFLNFFKKVKLWPTAEWKTRWRWPGRGREAARGGGREGEREKEATEASDVWSLGELQPDSSASPRLAGRWPAAWPGICSPGDKERVVIVGTMQTSEWKTKLMDSCQQLST